MYCCGDNVVPRAEDGEQAGERDSSACTGMLRPLDSRTMLTVTLDEVPYGAGMAGGGAASGSGSNEAVIGVGGGADYDGILHSVRRGGLRPFCTHKR